MSKFIDDEPKEAHAFIQWKGTDACFDFYCDCGEATHFDGYFAYVVECGNCHKEYEMPCYLIPRGSKRDGPKVVTEVDDD